MRLPSVEPTGRWRERGRIVSGEGLTLPFRVGRRPTTASDGGAHERPTHYGVLVTNLNHQSNHSITKSQITQCRVAGP